MSGHLEVKLPSKSMKGLTPWKSWKKQWCILRPCPLRENGAIIALHSSAGMSVASSVFLPAGSIVSRATSRSKKYSFGIFSPTEPLKPLVFMCGQSEAESQSWMGKIRCLVNGKRISGSVSLDRSFIVSLIDNEFSTKLQLQGLYGTIYLEKNGIVIEDFSTLQRRLSFSWGNFDSISIMDASDCNIDGNKICILTTNRDFYGGAGTVQLFSLSAASLVKSANQIKAENLKRCASSFLNRRLSKSEGNLAPMMFRIGSTSSKINVKWYVDTDDEIQIENTGSKNSSKNENKVNTTLLSAAVLLSSPVSQYSEASSTDLCVSSPELDCVAPLNRLTHSSKVFDRRCSGASISSGIYEEISEEIPAVLRKQKYVEKVHDNTYEDIRELRRCATERKNSLNGAPPPLPPRFGIRCGRLDSTSDSGLDDESWGSTPSQDSSDLKWNLHHCSTGSLPRCYSNPPRQTDDRKGKSGFSIFRKRIKSDSRVVTNVDATASKCSTMPRKKRFDFNVTPAKSISLIKNSKVGRVIMNMKSSGGSVKSDVVKSCEFLNIDDEDLDSARRCSRSVENLDVDEVDSTLVESDGTDLSLMYASENRDDSLSHDLFELILKNGLNNKHRYVNPPENYYMPMSPRAKVIEEQHYVVMTPPKMTSVDKIASIK